jgi:hypothetical protein
MLSEILEAAILVVLVAWAILDRFNIYFRRPPKP